MKPISVDVISPLLEGWSLCLPCEMLMAQVCPEQDAPDRGLDEYPADWQADARRLAELLLDLAMSFGGRVMIRVWDPRSLPGMVKSLRHGVRSYPTFIIAGKKKITGWDVEQVRRQIIAAAQGDLPAAPVE